jgi:hypothetical protein
MTLVLTILLPCGSEAGWIGGGIIRISASAKPAIEPESPAPDALAVLIPGGTD